jgi:large subunit ribosomal protein L20
MVRVKGGIQNRKNHKKVLALAKGYRMTRRKQIKVATQAVLHAGQYAYAGRKLRKRDFRSLWITRINAALGEQGIKYSTFINKLKIAKVELDRKILSQIATEHPAVFAKITTEVMGK